MRRVEVEWIDSMGHGGWSTADEARRRATPEALRHRTLGYVLEQTDDSLLLAMGRSDEGDNDTRLVHDTMQIPLVVITAVHELRAAGRPRSAGRGVSL